jgi:isopentenyldiphosphate isomerase
MHDDEQWQVFSGNGQAIVGAGRDKQDFRSGELICGAVHVWIWRRAGSDIEVLLQRRADNKPTWPGYLDISAAGHINVGESPIEAALREGAEEIGGSFAVEKLVFLFALRKKPPIYDELDWIYLYEYDGLDFKLHDGEVASLEWVTLEKFLWNVDHLEESKIVPHSSTYFDQLVKHLNAL